MSMKEDDDDARVLSYGDVLLRKRDLTSLAPHNWLTDSVIEFYFEFLSNELKQKAALHDRVLLVGPSTSFWVQSCGSQQEAAAAVKDLYIANKALVLFPVNNNSDVEEARGGSHWSLLILHRDSGSFFNLDSAGTANSSSAQALASSLKLASGVPTGSFQNVKFPHQQNAYDCGMFVLCAARVVCDLLTDCSGSCPPWAVIQKAMLSSVSQGVVTEERKKLKDLILSLKG